MVCTLNPQEVLKLSILFPPQVETEKSRDFFSKEDDYLDEEDIKERFKDKPEQLEKVLAQKPLFKCSITGAEMRAVPKYKRVHTEGKECEKQTKQEIKQEHKAKAAPPAKKAKVEKADPGPPQPVLKPLSEPQKNKLTKQLSDLEKSVGNIEAEAAASCDAAQWYAGARLNCEADLIFERD